MSSGIPESTLTAGVMEQQLGQGQVGPASDIWVRKWVDYSSKYGLGYLLSNGHAGVYFNDSTKVILNQKSQ